MSSSFKLSANAKPFVLEKTQNKIKKKELVKNLKKIPENEKNEKNEIKEKENENESKDPSQIPPEVFKYYDRFGRECSSNQIIFDIKFRIVIHKNKLKSFYNSIWDIKYAHLLNMEMEIEDNKIIFKLPPDIKLIKYGFNKYSVSVERKLVNDKIYNNGKYIHFIRFENNEPTWTSKEIDVLKSFIASFDTFFE